MKFFFKKIILGCLFIIMFLLIKTIFKKYINFYDLNLS